MMTRTMTKGVLTGLVAVPMLVSSAWTSATGTAGAATTAAIVTATPSSPVAAAKLTRGFSVPTKAASLRQVAVLRVAAQASLTGYSRTKFPHWRDASTWGWPVAPSNRCDTRNAALYRDGSHVKINAACTVTSGTWLDPYTSKTYTTKSSMDIDHLVPLAAAWRAGAGKWTTTRRTQYANDPLVLVSVQDRANESKGDKTIDAWKPGNKAAWCLYAKRYTAIKTKYSLTITTGEKKTLTSMIGTCTA